MLKKTLLLIFVLSGLFTCMAAEKIPFTGLVKANHISGPAVTQKMMQGKVVLFDYWGLGCGPCHMSMPRLEALWKKYGGKYLIIIGSESWRRNRNQIKAFLKKGNITFPIYQGATYNNFRPGGVPHAVLIDPDGKLVEMNHPARLYGKVEKMCKDLERRSGKK